MAIAKHPENVRSGKGAAQSAPRLESGLKGFSAQILGVLCQAQKFARKCGAANVIL